MDSAERNNKVLEVKNLRISFKTNGGTVKAVRGISFSLYKNRTLAIVGESGSGKSVTSKAILGILANNKIIEGGQIIYDGKDLLTLPEEQFTKLRGVKLSMIFQDPLSSLNPIMIVGKQLTEAIVLKHRADKKEGKRMLAKLGVRLKSTDAAKYAELENTLKSCKDPENIDLSSYFDFFHTAVMESAERRNQGISTALPAIKEVYEKYFSDDTIDVEESEKALKGIYHLLKSCNLDIDVEVDNVVSTFPILTKKEYKEVNLAYSLLSQRQADLKKEGVEDYWSLSAATRAKRREVIMTPEEHMAAIVNATSDLLAHLEALLVQTPEEVEANAHHILDRYTEFYKKSVSTLSSEKAKEQAIKMLGQVGIANPEARFKQYPFELSGGMRQRVVIAIALCSRPEVLICDEPTTALDVTIQSQILELINSLKKELNLSIVFITHDLGVVANMADDIAVMYAGKIVEYGTAEDIFYDPRHPYTWALLGSVPDLNTKEKLNAIPGTTPNMLIPPKGDAFAIRNKDALAIDSEEEAPFFEVSPTHAAATWNLAPEAPDLLPPAIVLERIKAALTAHPEYTPIVTSTKNSPLNFIFDKASKKDKKEEKPAEEKKEEAPKAEKIEAAASSIEEAASGVAPAETKSLEAPIAETKEEAAPAKKIVTHITSKKPAAKKSSAKKEAAPKEEVASEPKPKKAPDKKAASKKAPAKKDAMADK